jgi:SAM-dependent methyltransferase
VRPLPRHVAGRVSRRSRQRKLELFVRLSAPSAETSVLDVGVEDGGQGDDVVFATGNFVEHGWPAGRLTAVGLHDGVGFRRAFPDVEYVQGDGRSLPFADASFDIVICNAVVEHVGDVEEQRRLVAECCRVGRTVFVTTPNRWFPVELHSLWPLVHWLPERVYRPLLQRRQPARVGALRLLTPRSLLALFPPGHEAAIAQRGMTIVAVARRRSPAPASHAGAAASTLTG